MRSTGTLLCLASGCASGTMAIFGKLAYGEGFTAATLVAARFALAAALFWLLAGTIRAVRQLPRRDVVAGLALGAVGYAAQAACYFAALERIDASLLSLVVYAFPALVAAAAIILGRERADRRRTASLSLALGGLALVVAGAGAGALDPLGISLAALTAVLYAAYVLIGDGLTKRVPAQALATLICTGAAVPLVAGGALSGQLAPAQVTAAGWGWAACLAAISTVAAIGLLVAGMKHVGPTTASILVTVEPVVTVLLAFAAFGERLGPVQLFGGALVVSAVLVVHARRPRITWTGRMPAWAQG